MHVVESLEILIRMCEMWSSALKDRAFWHGVKCKCLHSYQAVREWQNRKVCAAFCRRAFGLIVLNRNRANLYYKRHLDCNTVGYLYNAVQHIMLLLTVLQWQQQNINQTLNSQKTCNTCKLWGVCREIWGKLHRHNTIALYMNIFKA